MAKNHPSVSGTAPQQDMEGMMVRLGLTEEELDDVVYEKEVKEP
jgi:hypothetical protein